MGGTSTGGRPPRTARVRQAHQGPVTERDGATVAFEAVRAIGPYGRRFRGGYVPGADDGGVAPVQGSHIGQLEPLGDCDGYVDRTERQVGVGAHEPGHARQVGGGGGEVPGLGLP